MLRDWCTWDEEYNLGVVQVIRKSLVNLATVSAEKFTTILMQGSGTFSVESVIGSVIPPKGKLLVISNGAYGDRMVRIAEQLGIPLQVLKSPETLIPDLKLIRKTLLNSPDITHVSVVHCETTTGILNPVKAITDISKEFGITTIVDAMSSFGGIPMDIDEWKIDFLISSANKCIQGVPGFGFILARTEQLVRCNGYARSYSLDLYDQWVNMEKGNGKWRFTSPTHVVRAFLQALTELKKEGGIEKRYSRYSENQKMLVQGMRELGFTSLLEDQIQSPIITSFLSPRTEKFSFQDFYNLLKSAGFVIYPGKISDHDTFRIGNIGEIYRDDIIRLLQAIAINRFWL
jgi:2-aminoethylphosphonate-pyruvate transaminase